jgi:hypothetical protein
MNPAPNSKAALKPKATFNGRSALGGFGIMEVMYCLSSYFKQKYNA